VDNFNPCSPNAFAQTNGSYAEIFEPLIIIDNVQFKVHPRLASSYAWSKDLKSITFTLRHGLKWSDGQPLTVQDVYYSAWTLPNSKNHGLCAPNPSVAGSTIVDPDKITVRLKTADVTQLFTNLQLAVYPQHIFRTIKDFTTWVWTKPVGSGPFTEVKDFTPQAYEIDANPPSSACAWLCTPATTRVSWRSRPGRWTGRTS